MLQAVFFFIAAFATIVALVWVTPRMFQPREDPLGDRLTELQSATQVGGSSAGGMRYRRRGTGFFDRYLNFLSTIPGADDWLKGCEKRLKMAGYRGEKALGIYAVLANLTLVLCLGGMLFLQRNNDPSGLLGGLVAAGIIGFMGPNFVLGKMSQGYKKRLQEALPDTVDLLGIVLGTGLALDQAMMRVSEEMQYIYPELANEFYTVVMQVRAGQERSKAFNSLVKRTGIEDIKSLAAMIIQSERFGTSLSMALKVYADALRMRRKLRAEAAVGKAGIKMLFPIVIFILPVLFVITLVPGMLSVLHDLKMLGGK